MKHLGIALVAVLHTQLAGAQEYADYFDDFASDSKTVYAYQFGQSVSNIAVFAGWHGANLGVISPFLINRLDLSVAFKNFNFAVPAPFAGLDPMNVTFNVGGKIQFLRNGNVLPYAPQPFSFNVRAICVDGFCHNHAATGQTLSSVQFSRSRVPPAPFFPYDFSVGVDSLSVAGVNYYPAALNGVELELDYKYSAYLKSRTMSDFTKAVGWSFEQAGKTQMARGGAMDDLLSAAGTVNTAASLKKYVVDGQLSPEGMVELKMSVDAGREFSKVRSSLNQFLAPTPGMTTQGYALDVLDRSTNLGVDAVTTVARGGKLGALELLRAVNLTAMSLNLGAAAVGAWVSADPPDFNFKEFANLNPHYASILKLEDLWGEAESQGLFDETLAPLRNLLFHTSNQSLTLASSGVSFERYLGAFLSKELDFAFSQYSEYRSGSEQLPELSSEYALTWEEAARELRTHKLTTVSIADVEAAREVIRAAIEYVRGKAGATRNAESLPTEEELTALLAGVEALKIADLQALTMADLLLPNYGQIAIDRYAVTSVPEAPTWAMLLIGAMTIFFGVVKERARCLRTASRRLVGTWNIWPSIRCQR